MQSVFNMSDNSTDNTMSGSINTGWHQFQQISTFPNRVSSVH